MIKASSVGENRVVAIRKVAYDGYDKRRLKKLLPAKNCKSVFLVEYYAIFVHEKELWVDARCIRDGVVHNGVSSDVYTGHIRSKPNRV